MCCYCSCCTVSDLILYIVAFFIPPVGVLLRSGCCSSDLLLNILLTMLGVVPGMIHAFYYITVTSPLRRAESRYYYQSGWEDARRAPQTGSGSHQQPPSGVVREELSAETPLVAHNGKSGPSDDSLPPPYSATV
ncbi:LAME_0E06678g1_1 [Lachancea meyersii CBS 8951]|uniref:LAME_0E06678g1_1 n=1 Tax=Lachancea meyersii CBS 8951 TaxID=1266667 RepID=A0A1G4JI49_9SACH|nr:LAME_0E06678g1_1 [Lachancea meyersii CBS 8951]